MLLGIAALGLLFLGLAVDGIRSGTVLITHGRLERSKQPVAFWSFVVVYLLFFAFIVFALLA